MPVAQLYCAQLRDTLHARYYLAVYKEKALGDTEIDAIYLNFWVAVWQFVLGFPLLLPMAPASNLPISQIGTNLWSGAKCYMGINSMDGDNCGLAPLFVSVYILFNLAYNVLIILSAFLSGKGSPCARRGV